MAKRSAKKTTKRRKKLTPTEKRALVKAQAKAVKFVSGQRLDPVKRDELIAVAETLKQRPKPKVGIEAIALWAAKIDWAIVNGDVPAVVKLIKTPVSSGLEARTQLWDSNGNCGCGGGGGGGA